MPPKPVLGLLALALVGHGVRLALVQPGEATGGIEIISAHPSGPASPLAHRDSIAALSRPLRDGERINVDQATVPEIARLPRVGVALAKRIAADRAARGPFGNLEALDRVPGIGPALLGTIAPHVAFATAAVVRPPANPAPVPVTLTHLVKNEAVTSMTADRGEPSLVETLNRATPAQLDRLPGIGPARAAAIVRYREAHGPFAALADLARVPGINPAQMQRLYDHLQVP
jgi:competence ComEA-like helix-hairpin-helix protein